VFWGLPRSSNTKAKAIPGLQLGSKSLVLGAEPDQESVVGTCGR